MNDDKLKDLFQNFKPELSSDFKFLTKLQRNMDALELVKHQTAMQRKRNRIAVIVAAITGFVMGVIITILFPILADTLSTFSITLPAPDFSPISINWQIIGYILAAIVSVFTALNAYEITLSRLSRRKEAAAS